jgi:hypothetical protein
MSVICTETFTNFNTEPFNYAGFLTLYKVGSRSIMSLILLCLCLFPPGEPGVPYIQLEYTLAGAPIMPRQVSQQVTQVAAGNTAQRSQPFTTQPFPPEFCLLFSIHRRCV